MEDSFVGRDGWEYGMGIERNGHEGETEAERGGKIRSGGKNAQRDTWSQFSGEPCTYFG